MHIYLTMFALLAVMFFAVTGLLLRHEDWLGADPRPTELHGTFSPALLGGPDKLMVVEELRAHYGAIGAVSSFDIDDKSLHVEFKGPGRHTAADIDRATGTATVSVERRPFMIRMDDLHRGKDSGAAWGWVIDASAVLLFISGLTGILMWFALPRRRKWGLAALISSVVILAAIYVTMVP